MESKKLLPISIMILAVSVVFGSIWIGYLLSKTFGSPASVLTPAATIVDSKVLNLSQAAEYLQMSEEEVCDIIESEKKQLDETHSFTGKMFPHFTVNKKFYFYKDEIDKWLEEVSSQRMEYQTAKGWVNK